MYQYLRECCEAMSQGVRRWARDVRRPEMQGLHWFDTRKTLYFLLGSIPFALFGAIYGMGNLNNCPDQDSTTHQNQCHSQDELIALTTVSAFWLLFSMVLCMTIAMRRTMLMANHGDQLIGGRWYHYSRDQINTINTSLGFDRLLAAPAAEPVLPPPGYVFVLAAHGGGDGAVAPPRPDAVPLAGAAEFAAGG